MYYTIHYKMYVLTLEHHTSQTVWFYNFILKFLLYVIVFSVMM